MKRLIYPLILLLFPSFFSACKQNNDPIQQVNVVSLFAYNGLSQFYFWADEVAGRKPTPKDQDPKKYFYSLLNITDKEHSWSFITDDVEALRAGFSGNPKALGFSFALQPLGPANTELIAVVKYVFPNTPAFEGGVKRLDVIREIDGEPITRKNLGKLFEADGLRLGISDATAAAAGFPVKRSVELNARKITTDPVLYHRIYELGGKKIAYLFYTGFIAEYNKSLFKVFSSFKAAGVDELVLDLRYNHGGAVGAARYLASLIAPQEEVARKSVFLSLSYNKFLNQYFDQNGIGRSDSLGVYNPKKERNPLEANLNLKKVYILATDDSYSASELTTFCLKPYMEVVHIGTRTGGKYTASFTVHPYDADWGVALYNPSRLSNTDKATLKNWAMQPIVAIYTDSKNRNFSNPGYLAPNHNVEEGGLDSWVEIGDTRDRLLGQAIFLITGEGKYKPKGTKAFSLSRSASRLRMPLEFPDAPNEPWKESVILDDLKLPDFWKD